ncbi:MAG TPA: hypothetical protein VMZ22_09550, partial [Acidimicrobiales bacterium]|nr:hypothetical protein [Acidimicrobiales bacterium]
LNGVPGSDENFRLGAPHHVSLHKDDNRSMKDLVAAAMANGFFDPAKGFKKLGILDVDCIDMVHSPENGLFAYLRSAGIQEWVEFAMSCDVRMARSSARDAVNKFADEGVSHVLLAVGPPHLKEYTIAAGTQGFRPKHFTSDYAKVILGGLADQYDMSFDGALGVTQTHVGEGPVGKPLSPLAQKCSKILTDRGVAPISSKDAEDINDDLEVLELCENFLLFLDVATRAGRNLTRETWLDALAQTGEFRGATVDLARFSPGKRMGGDTTKIVQWRANCTLGSGCWRDVTGFSPAAG